MKLLIRWAAILSLVSVLGGEYLLSRSQLAQALPKNAILITQSTAYDFTARALSHLKAKNFQQAFDDASQAIKIDPTYRDAYMVRANASFELGDNEGGHSDWQTARTMLYGSGIQRRNKKLDNAVKRTLLFGSNMQRRSKDVEKLQNAAKNAQGQDTKTATASPSPKPAQPPQTAQDVYAVAGQTTVLIEGQNPGSGVILAKTNNTYYVLTAKHVVATPDEYKIIVAGGKEYDVDINKIKRLSNLDLAIVEFTSSQNYPVARVGNSDQVKQGANIYVSGWPIPDQAISKPTQIVTEGQVVGLQADDKDGYGLLYGNNTAPGMSGGPVLNADGQLVGIHGRAAGNQTSGKVGINLGIPINLFLQSANQAGISLQQMGLKAQN